MEFDYEESASDNTSNTDKDQDQDDLAGAMDGSAAAWAELRDDRDDDVEISDREEGPGMFSDKHLGSSTFAPRANAERTNLQAFRSVRIRRCILLQLQPLHVPFCLLVPVLFQQRTSKPRLSC